MTAMTATTNETAASARVRSSAASSLPVFAASSVLRAATDASRAAMFFLKSPRSYSAYV